MSDPVLAVNGLTVARDGRTVISGASLALAAGERLAIAGGNGAGKSTLLRALIGLEPAGGAITAFGRDCRAEGDFRAMRLRTGFLFQDSDDQLFNPTVIEDVAFAPLNRGLAREEAFARASQALADLAIGHLAGRPVDRLSGGEKRLACLAGLFVAEPDLLLLDEPSNGVDRAHAERLVAILSQWRGAMILVSHDTEFLARLAGRVMLLDGGRLRPALVHRHPHVHAHAHVHPVSDD
ncbi:MAG: ABC transporter ATP-binding protein [Rhizobiaceae bacterium]